MIHPLHSPSTINIQVNKFDNEIGQFILAYDKSTITFILHCRIASDFLSNPNRKSIIQSLGFSQSNGCDFFGGAECFSTSFYKTSHTPDRMAVRDREVEYAHHMFRQFTERFGEICDHALALDKLIPRGQITLPITTYSFEVSSELLKSGDTPAWVDKEAPESQHQLKDDILNKIQLLQNDYVSFSHLLYESGDALEDAVNRFFTFLGLTVEKTEKSFPVDLFARDKDICLAIEVTGTNGNINNKDRKVGQTITYAGEMQEGEKIILAANTFRDRPLTDRPAEAFTKEAIKILTPFEICLVTTSQLYRLWKQIITGEKSKEEVIQVLLKTSGEFEVD